MAQLAGRLDDGNPFTVKGNLGLGWSGQVGQPAWCRWDRAMVIFNNNSIQADLAAEEHAGADRSRPGFFNGKDFEVHGVLNLDSVNVMGQQITKFESPLHVAEGRAGLEDIRGSLLGGTISGRVELSLDATPSTPRRSNCRRPTSSATLRPPGQAIVQRPARRPDRPERPGPRPAYPAGDRRVYVTKGDLGTLPIYLRLVNILRLPSATKSAFDSADVAISIRNGESYLDPIQFTGNAFSLHGRGT